MYFTEHFTTEKYIFQNSPFPSKPLLKPWYFSTSDVLEAYYHPTSFMRLSLTTCWPLFEELLLVLQPLSLLTFNLDLLFQHHHLEADSHRPEMPRSTHREAGLQASPQGQLKSPAGRYMKSLSEVDFGSPEHSPNTNSSPILNNGGSESSTSTDSEPVKALPSFGQTSPQLLWVQEKEIETLPLSNVDEDSFTHQAGQVSILSSSAYNHLWLYSSAKWTFVFLFYCNYRWSSRAGELWCAGEVGWARTWPTLACLPWKRRRRTPTVLLSRTRQEVTIPPSTALRFPGVWDDFLEPPKALWVTHHQPGEHLFLLSTSAQNRNFLGWKNIN